MEEPDNTRSEHTISVTYDKESRPTDVTCESRRMTAVGVPDTTSKRKLAYRYDGLGRVFQRDFYTDGDANTATATPLLRSAYAYCEGGYGANSTSPRVRSLEQAGRKYVYEYDKLGNIIRECWQGKATEGGALSFDSDPIASPDGDPLTLDAANLGTRYNTTYAYDALGQLLRANDERAQATWTYEYDQGGNILEKKRYAFTTVADLSALTPEQIVPYSYGDAGWKDKLTSFDGKPITHDTIGNPLTYDSWAYTWKAGRMLQSMVLDGENPVNAQFTYDHTGLRVKKTVNDVDTFYTLNGKKITHIRKGTNNATGADAVQMHFVCDAQGRPMMVRTMDVDYAYLHNLQGDVVGIVDMNGVPVVEYGYDAWGKPVFTEGSMAETLGKDNPFRYRGYVWDGETGLYATATRYYNPNWGRFINADAVLGKIGGLQNHNIFAYCGSNPINRTDPTGEAWWHWVIAAVVVVACAVAVVVTAGGATPALVAVASVTQGIAATTTASTVAAATFVGSSTALAATALVAAADSNSVDDFLGRGDWGTVATTIAGGILEGGSAYISARDVRVGQMKPSNKKGNGYPGVQYTDSRGGRKSFELHPPHKSGPHQSWHWQQNTWNTKTNSITNKSKHWTLFGRRF